MAYRLPEKIFLQPISRAVQEQRATLLREWRQYKMPEGFDDFTAVKAAAMTRSPRRPPPALTFAPEGVKMAVIMIDATANRPGEYFQDPVIFMACAMPARSSIQRATRRRPTRAEALL